MIRTALTVLIGSLALGGCADPELAKRVDELEKEVAELKKAPPKAGAPQQANAEEEQAAADLLKAASAHAEKMEYDQAKKKLADLKAKYGTTRAARAAARLDSELAVIGKDAGDLQVDKWFQGDLANLNDGTTLLVFWEVWCPHCKRAMPELQRTWESWGDKGLQVVGLTKRTRSATDEGILTYLDEQGITFPIGLENGESTRDYDVYGVPAAAVVTVSCWRSSATRLQLDPWPPLMSAPRHAEAAAVAAAAAATPVGPRPVSASRCLPPCRSAR